MIAQSSRSIKLGVPYKDGKLSSFWSTGVRVPLQKNIRFDIDSILKIIDKDSIICAAGSCFAQHIGKNLIKRKYNFLTSEFNENRTESFGFGNIYTTKQMLHWLEFCTGKKEWSDQTYFENKKNQIFDYLTPHLLPVHNKKDLFKRRKNIGRELKSYINKANIFIFTCGLTEQWETTKGEALAMAPGTTFGVFSPSKHCFSNLKVSEILKNLNDIEKIILTLNPKMKFLYTVSPIPLTATAEKEHVLVATSFSKAKLRAAVGEHVRGSERSFYFPAYELITHNTISDWRFEKNLRNISNIGVDFVMQHGFKTQPKPKKHDKKDLNFFSTTEIFCEEQKLETLNRVKNNSKNHSNIFLIGDSHMGKLGEAFKNFGKEFYGGQIMNSSGFSNINFKYDKKKIFIPTENKKSEEIWENTYFQLEKCKGNAKIYTNIGFQANLNIPSAVDSINNPFLTIESVEEYFRTNHKKTLDLLKNLSKYGKIIFVEDPNTYSLFTSYPTNENILRLMKINFPTYTSYLKKFSKEINGLYIDKYHLILQKIHRDTGNGLNALAAGDLIHGSKIYYKKLAEHMISDMIKE